MDLTFTLDLNEPEARLALEVYAVAIAKDNPELSNEIWRVYLNRASS
jgi:hypothetical protein